MLTINKKNERLIESLLCEVLVIFIVAILRLMNEVNTLIFFIIMVCFSMWPIIELIKLKIKRNNYSEINENKLDVKLSSITWLILSVVLLILNFVLFKGTFWAIYPIIGIACWPLTMIIKFYLNK